MRRRSILLLAILIAIGVAAFLNLTMAANAGPHADGKGDLAFMNNPDAWIGSGADSAASGAADYTWGIPVCDATGTGAIVLDSVEPTGSLGAGATLIGALTHRIGTADDHGVSQVPGYPPYDALPGVTLRPIAGTAVTDPCSSSARTEVLVGLRMASTAGGGWRGVSIKYHVRGRPQTLLANEYIVICGTALTCEDIARDMPSSSPVR